MKIVYIASPYAGDVEKNVERAREYCSIAVKQGVLPVAPHLLFPQFLDDNSPQERVKGLEMAMELLLKCDELWVCGDRTTAGMTAEINYYKGFYRGERPILYKGINYGRAK